MQHQAPADDGQNMPEPSQDPSLPPLEADAVAMVLNQAPAGIAVEARDGTIAWVSATLEVLLGQSAGEVVGRTLEALPLVWVPGGPICQLSGPRKGDTEWLHHVRHPISGNAQAAAVHYFLDVTDAERLRIQVGRLQQALHGQVSTDRTTGLLNRRAVLCQLEAQVARSRRYANPLSVVLLRLGMRGETSEAMAEQRVLDISRLLRDQTRWPDIIARWDRQEFLLVLPETGSEAAGLLVDKLYQRLDATQAVHGRKGPVCTASFGVAEWIKGDDGHGLVNRAVEALR